MSEVKMSEVSTELIPTKKIQCCSNYLILKQKNMEILTMLRQLSNLRKKKFIMQVRFHFKKNI